MGFQVVEEKYKKIYYFACLSWVFALLSDTIVTYIALSSRYAYLEANKTLSMLFEVHPIAFISFCLLQLSVNVSVLWFLWQYIKKLKCFVIWWSGGLVIYGIYYCYTYPLSWFSVFFG